MLYNFNSIKVRLKRGLSGSTNQHIHQFQFHKGTIKTSNNCLCLPQDLLHFNSIKVRLKLGNLMKHLRVISIFQFHKGTIKTVISEL